MKKLENIVFKRLCHLLKQYSFKFEIYDNDYIFTYNNVWIYSWKTKRRILFTCFLKDGHLKTYHPSIFALCKHYYERRTTSEDLFSNNATKALADLWPMFRMIEADSPEEMMVKMDLARI